jgi:hypothetical protein
METKINSEIETLKKQVHRLQKFALFVSIMLVLVTLISAGFGTHTLIQATRFEVIDESGNVIQILDREGLRQNGQTSNQNWNNNSGRHNQNDRIRFIFNKLGSSSGFVQINNLAGETIATQNFYTQFDEKIIVNYNIVYYFDKNTKEVRFNNVLVIGNASEIDKAIDICLFHYVNNLFQP